MGVPVCTCRRKARGKRALSFLSQPLLSQISPLCHGALPYSQSPRASPPFLDQVHSYPGSDESSIPPLGLTLPSTPTLSLSWSFPPPCLSPSLSTRTIPAYPSCGAPGHHLREATMLLPLVWGAMTGDGAQSVFIPAPATTHWASESWEQSRSSCSQHPGFCQDTRPGSFRMG